MQDTEIIRPRRNQSSTGKPPPPRPQAFLRDPGGSSELHSLF